MQLSLVGVRVKNTRCYVIHGLAGKVRFLFELHQILEHCSKKASYPRNNTNYGVGLPSKKSHCCVLLVNEVINVSHGREPRLFGGYGISRLRDPKAYISL
jgi:hypothetical protein